VFWRNSRGPSPWSDSFFLIFLAPKNGWFSLEGYGMATLRDIRRRIQSVKKTAQITKAMQMVAAARLRRMQEALESTRPYAEKMDQVVGQLAGKMGSGTHPLLEERPGRRKMELVVVSSDRGLCGGLNTNLFRKTRDFLAQNKDAYESIVLYLIGQKARDFYKRRDVTVRQVRTHLFPGRPQFEVTQRVARDLVGSFLSGEADEVGVIFTQFQSVMTQRAVLLPLLPLKQREAAGAEGLEAGDCIYEPSREALLEKLLPRYVEVRLFWIMLEAQTSEFAARMTAMDSATSNAKEMIERLTLSFNRARQAAITKELMDIVNGAEALR
jgi:F-type H+-transporting ATPase subunit gamma